MKKLADFITYTGWFGAISLCIILDELGILHEVGMCLIALIAGLTYLGLFIFGLTELYSIIINRYRKDER